MNYRRRVKVPLLLFFLLAISLSLPKPVTLFLQQGAVNALHPFFTLISWIRGGHSEDEREKERLLSENQLLLNEIDRLKNTLLQETFIDKEVGLAKELQISLQEAIPKLTRRRQELEKLLSFEISVIPADVIFRPIASWSSTLWINVGERDNRLLERPAVSKNSPVVLGKCVVGVVEEVGEKLSRVRLLTDPELCPSVRVIRKDGEMELYLAKGELKGSVGLKFRQRENVLRGIGFNYDYRDDLGPARNLVDGKREGITKGEKMALVKEGDTLATTGMDGVFPPGLIAGYVKKVYPLQEGDYTISLEALPAISDFNALTHVFVLPSLNAG